MPDLPEHGDPEVDVVVTEPVLQYEAQHPIALSIGDEGTKVYPTGTPVKVSKVTVRRWTDSMKLELLREYIKKAEDPMERAPTPAGKACYKKQLKIMLDKGAGILLEGDTEKTRLSSVVSVDSGPDTLAQFLIGAGRKGLTGQKDKPAGQGGLVHIIDEWVGQQGDNLVDIREHVDDIIEFAKSFTS